MHNLTDNIIKNAIKVRLGKFDYSLLVELLFYFYLIYRYLGFLAHLVKDIFTAKEIASVKESKEVKVRQLKYGFERGVQVDLSIIVPAYNVEKYIKSCIYSILEQDIKCNYEILIINDCSTDSTKEFLDEFLHHKNIRIFNLKKNQGLSAARNLGILNSVGKYLMFLDSDDFLYGNCIQKCIDQAMNYDLDIVEFSYARFQSEKTIDYDLIESVTKPVMTNIYSEMLDFSTGYAWAKLYKRELFENIRFPEGVLFEDGIIHKIVFRLCNQYMHLGCVGYLYRDAPDSITKSIKNKNLVWDHLYMIQYCVDETKRLNLSIDNLFFRQLIQESGLMMKNRSFYLNSPDLLFIFSRLTDLLNEINKGFNLTIREQLILICIKNRYINAWKKIAF
ncbi:glycosyltransferase family 2 protein [Acinetobacter terrae]|uniref:Glycosyltransferase family 2 protein n=1 Tax=Acinetobacter terrae TaxID=2731247 RepID=A0A8E4F8S5_9GAMM|nr:glycosyltransferase family 2 protein [Acinetobacter terrae]NNH38950.1 glycosyltransferase family 2 protein [Acinetobacter terrae]